MTTEKNINVIELEKRLGIEFKLYMNTGSCYGYIGCVKIRLSDHASKFTEKNENGIDLNYNNSVDYMYDRIMNKVNEVYSQKTLSELNEELRITKNYIMYLNEEGTINEKKEIPVLLKKIELINSFIKN